MRLAFIFAAQTLTLIAGFAAVMLILSLLQRAALKRTIDDEITAVVDVTVATIRAPFDATMKLTQMTCAISKVKQNPLAEGTFQSNLPLFSENLAALDAFPYLSFVWEMSRDNITGRVSDNGCINDTRRNYCYMSEQPYGHYWMYYYETAPFSAHVNLSMDSIVPYEALDYAYAQRFLHVTGSQSYWQPLTKWTDPLLGIEYSIMNYFAPFSVAPNGSVMHAKLNALNLYYLSGILASIDLQDTLSAICDLTNQYFVTSSLGPLRPKDNSSTIIGYGLTSTPREDVNSVIRHALAHSNNVSVGDLPSISVIQESKLIYSSARFRTENIEFLLALRTARGPFFESSNRAQIISTVVCAAVCIACAGVCLFVWKFTVSPLVGTAKMMKTAAAIEGEQNSTDEEAQSWLDEIASLQSAFGRLREELRELRRYLPEGLVRQIHQTAQNEEAPAPRNIQHQDAAFTAVVEPPRSVVDPPPSQTSSNSNEIRSPHSNVVQRRISILCLRVVDTAASVPTESSVKEFAEAVSGVVMPTARAHQGIAEVEEPYKILITFNAHVPCATHETSAFKCALQLAERLAADNLPAFYIGVDATLCWVGTIGDAQHSSRIVLGEALDVAQKIPPFLQSHCCDAHIAVTERIARVLLSDLVPFEVLHVRGSQWCPSSDVCLYEPVITSLKEDQTSDLPSAAVPSHYSTAQSVNLIKNAFSQLRSGSVGAASALLSEREYVHPDLLRHAVRLHAMCAFIERRPSTSQSVYSRSETSGWESFPFDVCDDPKMENSTPHLPPPPAVVHRPDAEAPTLADPNPLVAMPRTSSGKTEDDRPSIIVDDLGNVWHHGGDSPSASATSVSQLVTVVGPHGTIAAFRYITCGRRSKDVLSTLKRCVNLPRHANLCRYIGASQDMSGSSLAAGRIKVWMDVAAIHSYTWHSACQVFGSNGRLPTSRVRHFCRDVLGGLAYLHINGIVHGNLDSSTVILGADGTCRLVCYGLPPEINVQPSPNVAPEVTSAGECTPASDMWAFGVMLCEQYGIHAGDLEDLDTRVNLLSEAKNTESVREMAFLGKLFPMIKKCLMKLPEDRVTAQACLLSMGNET